MARSQVMAKFLQVCDFDIFNDETGEWAPEDNWWTKGDCVYQSDLLGEDGKPLVITVPSGFMTDLASIPKFPPALRTLFIRNGNHRIAAVVHDYLCRTKLVKRTVADKVFLEAMKLVGINRVRRRLMYWGVSVLTLFMRLKGDAQ
jgi:hypothetical protein